MKLSPAKQIKDGLIANNPIFVQFLGMCSALAITTSVTNAVGMGISVTAVLICSNVLISLLRKFIVPQIRIAAFIVIISGFVTAVELLIKAYLPELDKSLGLFIPLIVVNCIILARAESFASKNGVVSSAIDGFAMGVGYTVAVVITAAVRELLGTGKLLAAADGSGGFTVLGDWYSPASIFILPPGAFLTLAFLCALFQKLRMMSDGKKHDVSNSETDDVDDSQADGEMLYAAELAADMTSNEVPDEYEASPAEEYQEIEEYAEEYAVDEAYVEESAGTDQYVEAEASVEESAKTEEATPVEEYVETKNISDDFIKKIDAEKTPAKKPRRNGVPVFDFDIDEEFPIDDEGEKNEIDFSGVFDFEPKHDNDSKKGDKR